LTGLAGSYPPVSLLFWSG